MKVNLSASYSEVIKLVNASKLGLKPAQESQNFEQLLSSVSPSTAKEMENAQKMAALKSIAHTVAPDPSPMARFNFDSAKMSLPELDLLKETEKFEAVKEMTPNVQHATPKIVSAKRISENDLIRSKEDIKDFVQKMSQNLAIDPALSLGVIEAESSFNVDAVSSDGHFSKGLFQLLDRTGKDLLARSGLEQNYTPFDPKQNVELGTHYLRYLHEIFSEETDLPNQLKTTAAANSSSLEKLALAAYNAGEGRVAAAQRQATQAGLDASEYDNVSNYLPETTQEYVQRVIRNKERFGSNSIS